MKELEEKVREFLIARGWDDLRPSDLAKSISIEAAELLELFQWMSVSAAEVKADPAKLQKLELELADVMIYCLEMSVTLGIDTKQAIEKKLQICEEKYPAPLMLSLNNKERDPGTDETYLKIKEEYRRKGLS